jgi:hypothetical protein
MRKELEEAKDKLFQMEHAVRIAERNLDVSRHDQKGLSESVAAHVAKLDKLLGHAKSMRQDRADQKLVIIAPRVFTGREKTNMATTYMRPVLLLLHINI